MKKKRRLFISVLSLALVLAMYMSISVQAAEIPQSAWPGRPGGTGTGSEEWLQGKYGETNGPWKYSSSHNGKILDLYRKSGREILGSAIITQVISKKIPYVGQLITAVEIGNALRLSQYKGDYYITKIYVSGRCMKAETKTYYDSSRTKLAGTYIEYIKW